MCGTRRVTPSRESVGANLHSKRGPPPFVPPSAPRAGHAGAQPHQHDRLDRAADRRGDDPRRPAVLRSRYQACTGSRPGPFHFGPPESTLGPRSGQAGPQRSPRQLVGAGMAKKPRTITITQVGPCKNDSKASEHWSCLVVCNVQTEEGSMVLQFTPDAANHLKESLERLPPPMRTWGLEKLE
jgi:hypothetical protein